MRLLKPSLCSLLIPKLLVVGFNPLAARSASSPSLPCGGTGTGSTGRWVADALPGCTANDAAGGATVTTAGGARNAGVAGAGGRRRCSALPMAKAAKEVVLRSVKVGPLKQENIDLPSGVSMQTTSQKPSTGSPQRSKPLPPLVFIHGSYHSGWCWAEHWMPFLAAKGYETYSISLRGTAGTRIPGAEADAKGAKIKVADHVKDVRSFAETVLPGRRPVFISHSIGGMVLLKLMEELANDEEGEGEAEGGKEDKGENSAAAGGGTGIRAAMAGGAFLCSVPPSGNGPMTKRFIKERPVMAVKIVVGFVLKMAVYWPWLARDLFFCQSLEQSALKRYMSSFKADSRNGMDLGDLLTQLPSQKADSEGRATWLRQAPPRLVVGAERDHIVDEAGVKEMATFLGTDHVMLPTVPHEFRTIQGSALDKPHASPTGESQKEVTPPAYSALTYRGTAVVALR